MSETPYVEADALLALIRDDRDEAVRLLNEMTAAERASLASSAEKLAHLADDRNRCRGCGEVPATLAGVVFVGFGTRERWHNACYTIELERRAALGDRRARAHLNLRHSAP